MKGIPLLRTKIVTLIKHIEEELVLVDFLVKWNMIYLKDPEDPELIRIIRVLLLK